MNNRSEKIIYKVSYKRGISLIVLIITIVVSLILIATAVIATTSAMDNANITMFSKNVTEIASAVEGFYITNNVMPTPDVSTVMTKNDLIGISASQNLLSEEIIENNDIDAQFYEIDLAKINVTKIGYGTKELGESDAFYISFPSMNVYYPYGINAKGTTYFSITSKISNVTKIPQNVVDNSTTSIISSAGIKVTKTNGWANKMGVNIEAQIAADETLYMSVSGGANRLITTVTGSNIFGFNLLTSIVSNAETIKVPTLTTLEANYIEAGTKPLAERYVDILKYKGSDVISKVRIDLSNFSTTLPTITTATTSSYPNMNTIKLVLANTDSAIKEVRYEFLTKYTENGTIDNYYSGVSSFDNTYMQSKAKKAQIANDLTTTITASKNVQSIRVALIDNAGNINSYTQRIAPNVYIGYKLDIATPAQVLLTSNMYSTNGIKSIKFSKSLDGITFTDEQSYTLNTTTNGVTTKQCTPFLNITSNFVYIKMVAVNYDSTITETRIIRVDFNTASGLGVYAIATTNTTVNGAMASYSNPIIPVGFKAINDVAIWPTDWNKGLIIEDASGNQFVWVPVDGTNVPYAKWCTTGTSYTTTTDDTLPAGIASEVSQITKYGGFYIARFEAGKESTATLVSKKLATVWSDINKTDSKLKAEAMYTTTQVKSGLVTGIQWDTVMKWIQNSGKSVVDSRAWGNHSDSIAPANVGFGVKRATGYNEFWKANNIYDLAGNTFEWTNELAFTGTSAVTRGGYYTVSGSATPAAIRNAYAPANLYPSLSFRTVLYIL
jgi:Tfp pilus assembly protein PilE